MAQTIRAILLASAIAATLAFKGTFLKLPETDVNLICLDRDCLDKDMNSNEAVAVSRITQNDQIGLLEPR
jgi:hypothetical protein